MKQYTDNAPEPGRADDSGIGITSVTPCDDKPGIDSVFLQWVSTADVPKMDNPVTLNFTIDPREETKDFISKMLNGSVVKIVTDEHGNFVSIEEITEQIIQDAVDSSRHAEHPRWGGYNPDKSSYLGFNWVYSGKDEIKE